jgi:hypothetical protein
MALHIYTGRQINRRSFADAIIDLPSDLINFLNAKNIFIDEYGTYTLQTEQIVIVERLIDEYLKTNKLEKKYLDDIKTLIEMGRNNSSITLDGD